LDLQHHLNLTPEAEADEVLLGDYYDSEQAVADYYSGLSRLLQRLPGLKYLRGTEDGPK
jgi:hypothetical protein